MPSAPCFAQARERCPSRPASEFAAWPGRSPRRPRAPPRPPRDTRGCPGSRHRRAASPRSSTSSSCASDRQSTCNARSSDETRRRRDFAQRTPARAVRFAAHRLDGAIVRRGGVLRQLRRAARPARAAACPARSAEPSAGRRSRPSTSSQLKRRPAQPAELLAERLLGQRMLAAPRPAARWRFDLGHGAASAVRRRPPAARPRRPSTVRSTRHRAAAARSPANDLPQPAASARDRRSSRPAGRAGRRARSIAPWRKGQFDVARRRPARQRSAAAKDFVHAAALAPVSPAGRHRTTTPSPRLTAAGQLARRPGRRARRCTSPSSTPRLAELTRRHEHLVIAAVQPAGREAARERQLHLLDVARRELDRPAGHGRVDRLRDSAA